VVFGSRCRPRRGSEPRVGFRDYKNYFGSICVAASVRPGSGRVHEHTTLGSRPAPGTPSAKRSVGHVERAASQLAASMQDTLSEGTARAAQLAPSAVTASAVGGSATRSVVADSLRRRAARARSTHARAHARSRGVEDASLAVCLVNSLTSSSANRARCSKISQDS